jgi:hypothetical protein
MPRPTEGFDGELQELAIAALKASATRSSTATSCS